MSGAPALNCSRSSGHRLSSSASEELRDLFFSNMSERAAKILREDMEAMGPVRLKDVDEAQMYLVTLAKDLSAKGEIVIAEEALDLDEVVGGDGRGGRPTQ